jgi:hypothetical protein
MATTRQSPSAIPMKPYGSFVGKTTESVTGRIMSSLAAGGGLAHKGGLAGKHGGLAG